MWCVKKRNNFFETSSKWATACHRSRQEGRGVALQGAIGGRVRYDRHGGPKTTNTCRSTDVGHWQPPTVAHLPTTVSKNTNFPLWILIHAYYLADQGAHVFKGKFVCVLKFEMRFGGPYFTNFLAFFIFTGIRSCRRVVQGAFRASTQLILRKRTITPLERHQSCVMFIIASIWPEFVALTLGMISFGNL